MNVSWPNRIFDDLERHADERLVRIGLELHRLRRIVPLSWP